MPTRSLTKKSMSATITLLSKALTILVTSAVRRLERTTTLLLLPLSATDAKRSRMMSSSPTRLQSAQEDLTEPPAASLLPQKESSKAYSIKNQLLSTLRTVSRKSSKLQSAAPPNRPAKLDVDSKMLALTSLSNKGLELVLVETVL